VRARAYGPRECQEIFRRIVSSYDATMPSILVHDNGWVRSIRNSLACANSLTERSVIGTDKNSRCHLTAGSHDVTILEAPQRASR
jgi:hypothetical protein